MVRALGRQPHLRHRRGRAGAGRGRRVAQPTRAIRRAVSWLERHQNADGGWGEDCRSYDDPAWIGRGESTPSQTAWALLALEAAGERDSEAVARGVEWLVANQRADGGWDEDHHTGTGFPVRLLHQIPPVPPDLPGDGAGALPAMSTVATARHRGRCRPASRCCPRPAQRELHGRQRDPRRRRARHLTAIYGFARLVDDVGDEAAGRPPGAARSGRASSCIARSHNRARSAATPADAGACGARSANARSRSGRSSG